MAKLGDGRLGELNGEKEPSLERLVKFESPLLPARTPMPSIGRVFGDRYWVREVVEEGWGTTRVRAKDRYSGHTVTLDVDRFEDDPLGDEVAVALGTASLAVTVEHANVAKIIDFGRSEYGECYRVTASWSGLGLRAYLSRRNPSFEEIVSLFDRILGGLAAAHEVGLVHGGVQPDHIEVCLSDERELQPKIHGFGRVFVHPVPDSPGNSDIDPRLDLHAVGVMFCDVLRAMFPHWVETLIGERENSGSWSGVVLPQPAEEEPRSPALESWLRRANAQEMDQGFPDARSMQLALRDCMGARKAPVSFATPSEARAGFERCRKRRGFRAWIPSVGLGAVVLAAVSCWVAAHSFVEEELGSKPGRTPALLRDGPALTDGSAVHRERRREQSVVVDEESTFRLEGVRFSEEEAGYVVELASEGTIEEFRAMGIRTREINRIIEQRPFGTIEELSETPGIGQRTLERLLNGVGTRANP